MTRCPSDANAAGSARAITAGKFVRIGMDGDGRAVGALGIFDQPLVVT